MNKTECLNCDCNHKDNLTTNKKDNIMSNYKERVILEEKELRLKYASLSAFLTSDEYKKLDPHGIALLNVQFSAMHSYLLALETMIGHFGED